MVHDASARTAPPIDSRAHERLETATFALG